MKSQLVFGDSVPAGVCEGKGQAPGKEIMKQIIPISPFQSQAFVVEMRNVGANETQLPSQPLKRHWCSVVTIRPKAALSVLVCILGLITFSACTSLRNHVSGRSWSQIAGQEQQEQENANENSLYGGY
jgi:hypothetical protein